MALPGILATLVEMNKRLPKTASPLIRYEKQEEILFTRTESGEVVFHYHQPFDRCTDEYDQFYGRFSKEQYERGKQQLTETGHCNITGYSCTLVIKRIKGFFEIFFNSQNKGIVFSRKTLDGFL